MKPIKSPISINLDKDDLISLQLLCTVFSVDPAPMVKALICDAVNSIHERLPRYAGLQARQLFVEKLQEKTSCKDEGLDGNKVCYGDYEKFLKKKLFTKKAIRDRMRKPFRSNRDFVKYYCRVGPGLKEDSCLTPNSGYCPQLEYLPLPHEIADIFGMTNAEEFFKRRKTSDLLTQAELKRISLYAEAIQQLFLAASLFPAGKSDIKPVQPDAPPTAEPSLAHLHRKKSELIIHIAKMVEDGIERHRSNTLEISNIYKNKSNQKAISTYLDKGHTLIDAVNICEIMSKINSKKITDDLLPLVDKALKVTRDKLRELESASKIDPGAEDKSDHIPSESES